MQQNVSLNKFLFIQIDRHATKRQTYADNGTTKEIKSNKNVKCIPCATKVMTLL